MMSKETPDNQPKRPTREQLEAIVDGATMDSEILSYLRDHDSDGSVHEELEKIKSEHGFLEEFLDANRETLSTSTPLTLQAAPEGYEILRELDRGAQGVVYLAHQVSTKRRVALKVMLQGAFSTQRQQQRFEREVELVASMKHPNIVTVFDSGITPDGRMFTAMEYIDGVPLNLHRTHDEPGGAQVMTTRERVDLFLKVCDAVGSAHRRGIIHRDLKPLNILVDTEGEPHVLDFGLAKVVGPDAMTESAMDATAAGEFMGTFAYASPEQVSGDPDLVDTRTDVYALGVILYDLLLGRRPYELGGNVHEMIKGIMETRPHPPRDFDPEFDLDLETILLTSLAKDVERRYQSVQDLADDLRCWCSGEPIMARRDDAWYVLRKFVLRHRLPVGLAACVVLLIVGFAITMAILYANVTLANKRLAGMLGMASDVIATADPENTDRPFTAATAIDMLEAWSDVVHEEMADEPEIRARILNDLGESFIGFDRHGLAQTHLEEAQHTLMDFDSEPDLETARSLHQLGRLAYKRAKYDEAELYFSQALAIREDMHAGPHIDTAQSLHYLGSTYRRTRSTSEAERKMRQAKEMLEKMKTSSANQGRQVITGELSSVINSLGILLASDRPAEAIDFYKEADAMLAAQAPDDVDWRRGRIQHNIGMCHLRLGDLEKARTMFEESLETKETGLRRLQAEQLVQEDEASVNRLQLAASRHALARTLLAMGDMEGAQDAAEAAREMRTDVLKDGHPLLADSEELQAQLDIASGNIEVALGNLQAIHADRLEHGQEWAIAWNKALQGHALSILDRFEEGEVLLKEAYLVLCKARGATSPKAISCAGMMASMYEAWDRPVEAQQYRMLADVNHAQDDSGD